MNWTRGGSWRVLQNAHDIAYKLSLTKQWRYDLFFFFFFFLCKICNVLFLSWNICLEKHQPRVIKPSSRGPKQLWIYWWLSQIPFSYSMRLFRKVCTFFRIRLRKSYAFFFKVNWRNFDTCKVGNFRASLPVLIRFSAIVFDAMRNKPKMENSFLQLSPQALN